MGIDKSRILVVGGAGFVGSNLVLQLLEYEPERIYIIDNFLSSDYDNVPDDSRVTLIPGSITDQSVLEQIPKGINFIFNLACFTEIVINRGSV